MNTKLLFCVILCMSLQPLLALNDSPRPDMPVTQQATRTISGVVLDQDNEPVIGANVTLINSTIGTITDMDGNFSFAIPSDGEMIQISYIGYISQQVRIDGKSRFDIVLVEDSKSLEEIVVVGYGTQKKAELTSSIVSVKSESFVKGAVRDAGQLIQGKVAGLGVVVPDSDPIRSTQVILRGAGTLRSSTSPLVIIDGVPGELNTIAPEDVESIDVVKDGSAAAIYGTRGNNGVIFVTTKKVRGKTPLTIDINTYLTTQTITKKLDMMSATDYRKLVDQGKPGAIDYGYDTDWLDEILRTPVSYVMNANIKGGNSESNYIANVNYRSNQGILKQSDSRMYTARLEVNHAMFNRLIELNLNIMGRELNYSALGDGLGDDRSARGEIYRNAIGFIPTQRPKDDDGKWIEHTAMHEVMNPLALIYEVSGENRSTQLRTNGSITVNPLDYLSFKVLGSRTVFNETRGYAESSNHYSTVKNGRNGFASRGTERWQEQLMEVTANYNQHFGDHNIIGLLGYSYQDYEREFYWMQNWNFPSDQYEYNNMGAGQAIKNGEAPISSEKTSNKLIGFFGRINYNYANRYLASVSLRHEGSSKFGVDHKWGNFPAASVGWNISNEEFMEDVLMLSNLKVRAGFGITGTVPDDAYISLSRLSTGSRFYLGQGNWTSTLAPESNANPDLRWEKKEEWNLGFDYGFLNDRIFGSIDLYKRTTKDMLWKYKVPMPPYLFDEITANAGTMRNKGLEVSVGFIPVQNNELEWTTTLNYSTNSNQLVSLSNEKFQVQSGFIDAGSTGEPIQQSTHRLYEGGKVGDFYGFKTIDITDDGYWIIEGHDGKPKSILDQVPEDKKIIGNGLPTHFLSWSNTLYYKNFDLSVLMRGAFGYDIINFPRLFYAVPINLTRGNLLKEAYEPKYGKTVLNDQQQLDYVSYFIEKGDYWKIDNITLGYTFKMKNKYVRNLRVYASGSNMFTITGYSGLDPEVEILGLEPGKDHRDRYPSTCSYTFGLMVTF